MTSDLDKLTETVPDARFQRCTCAASNQGPEVAIKFKDRQGKDYELCVRLVGPVDDTSKKAVESLVRLFLKVLGMSSFKQKKHKRCDLRIRNGAVIGFVCENRVFDLATWIESDGVLENEAFRDRGDA